ncbi:MAG: DUF2298 domain-containing protein [Candidatus Tritonobacter lacicola]|nr:DUF2298 domain-containing protein [Candidatus Tritonobacter lacicola]
MSRKKVILILVAILACGAALRFYGLDWGAPPMDPNPDERHIMMTTGRMLSERDLNPKTFSYGSLHFYILYGACRLLFTMFGGGPGVPFESLIMTGRYIAAAFGVLTILATYFLGRRLYSTRTGLIAALFLCLSVLHIQLSHFYIVDVVMALFCVCAILCASRLTGPGPRRLRWFVLLGACIGLSIATKFSGVPLFLVPCAVLVWGLKDRAGRRKIWFGFAVTVVVALAVWFVCEPYAFVGERAPARPDAPMKDRVMYSLFSRQFAHDIIEQGNMVKGYEFCSLPWTIQYENTMPYFYHLGELLNWWMGWPLGLSCLLGTLLVMARNVKRAERRDILILLWLLPVFLIIGGFKVKFPRYTVPLFPFLCVFGGNLFDVLLRRAAASRRRARLKRAAVAVMLAVVVCCSLFYSVAFVRIYGGPHNWIRASAWMYENIPRGSVIVREEVWDDELPVSVPGCRNIRYKKALLGLYGRDDRTKLAGIAGKLASADFIVMSTRRIYGTTLQDPGRFPVTGMFYRLLFSQKLGYELVKTFTSHPGLMGVTFNDDCADESFSVYDHPKVVIFKKVVDLDPGQIRALIESPPAEVAAITRAEILRAGEGGVKPVRGWEYGRLPRISGRAGSQLWQALRWLLVVEVLGLLALPLAAVIFSDFRDRGYILSKLLAILIVSYASWLLASLGWVGFSLRSSLLAVLFLAILSLAAIARNRGGLFVFPRGSGKIIVVEELVFLTVFMLYLSIRALNPDIYWGEKPMDFSFLNIIMRSGSFPPMEPWFSGTPLNYYYFGYCVTAVMSQLSAAQTSVAFNLANALVPALVAGGVFSLVHEMTKRVRWGVLGVFFATIMGNLDGVRQYAVSSSSHLYKAGIWDRFWATSRVLPHPSINEYPNWGFLFADLHAHVMVLPFAVLGFCVAYCLLKARENLVLKVLVAGLVLGALLFTNIWNYPVGAALFAVVLLFRGAAMKGRSAGIAARAASVVREGVVPLIAVLVLSVLFFLPYFKGLRAGSAVGYGMIGAAETAGIHHVLIHFGVFLFIFFTFSLFHIAAGRKEKRMLTAFITGAATAAFIALWGWLGPRVGPEGRQFTAYGAAWVYLVVFALTASCAFARGQGRERIFGMIIVLTGLVLCIIAEFFFLIDHMNTVFKLYVQAWLFFSIGGAYFICLASRLPAGGKLKITWAVCLIVLLAAGAFCSVTNMHAVADKSWVRRAGGPGLDGLNFKRLNDPDEYEAIAWMNGNIPGTPIVLEAWGPSYQEFTRISMNTGLPTVLGWEHHVFQRGNTRQEISMRKSDIRKIYRSTDKRSVLTLLQKYGIRYVVAGDLERRTYGDKGTAGFDRAPELFDKVYSGGSFSLYRVKDVDFEPDAPVHVIELPAVTMFEGDRGDLPGQFDQPRAIAVDGKYAYVSDTMNNRIQKFVLRGAGGEDGRAEAGRFAAQWGEMDLNQPCGIAVRGNVVYVADTWNHRGVMYTKEGKELATFGSGCYGPRGIAVDGRGDIYLADTGNGMVRKFDRTGKELTTWGKEEGSGKLKGPVGIAVDRKDRVYVADVGHGRIAVFDRSGKYLDEWSIAGWKGGSFVEPFLAVDRSGNVYVSDPTGNRIIKYDGSGKEIKEIAGGLDLPMGLALADGFLYISEAGANKISKVRR